MPDPYTVLGLAADADDEAVRRRYLELTREFPPEQQPEKFAAVRAAFEKVRTADARARYRLFDAGADDTIDALIEDATCRTPRRRPGLSQLISVAAPHR